MSVETWKSIADWFTILFIAATLVSGSAALILGDRINEKQKVEIEELRQKNLELEKSTLPRLIAIKSDKEGKSNIDSLRKFAGMRVEIECLPDAEPRMAAGPTCIGS